MILTIPRRLGGGCLLAALLVITSENGCSKSHSSSSNSCGLFFGVGSSGVEAFAVPSSAFSRSAGSPLYSSYLDSIASSVVPSNKIASYSPSSSSKSSPSAADDTPPPDFRSFSSSERTERKLRGTLGQLPIRQDHLQSLISDDIDYDTPELGDLFSNQGDVEAKLGRLVSSALSSINTYLPDDIFYDGRSDDGALLREWLSDPTNVRSLSRRVHFEISPGNVGATGLPDDERKGYGDIAAEERRIGKWAAYLTDPAVSSAMVNLALDDKFTYYPDDYGAGDISDEYRTLSSLKDYLTDPSSARDLIVSALDGIPTALPDDSPFSQSDDAATALRKWLDADPDNARRALIRFAMDDRLGYLSDDMASNAALPGYESVNDSMARYKSDPTTFSGPNSMASKAFAGDGASTVLSDDAIVGEELIQSLSSYLSDPTTVQRLAGFGGSPGINSDDDRFLPGYENVDEILTRYCQDPTTIRRAAAFGGVPSANADDSNVGEALKSFVGAWLSDPTCLAKTLEEIGVDGSGLLPDDIEYSAGNDAGMLWLDRYLTDADGRLNLSQWLSAEGNLERILSDVDDTWTYLPDDDQRDLGSMPARSQLFGTDPTNPNKANMEASGVETPKESSLYYGSGSNMERISSSGDDKVTYHPDDRFYLPGYESPNDTLGRYASDPTSSSRPKDASYGLDIDRSSLYYGNRMNGAAAAAAGPASSLAKIADGDPGSTFIADDHGRGVGSTSAGGGRVASSASGAAGTTADGGIDGHTFYTDDTNYGAHSDARNRSQRDGGHFYYGVHARDDYVYE